MAKQIPNWLFGTIIVFFTLGLIGLLGSAMKPAASPTAPLGPMGGKTAPDFSGKTADGKELHLSDYKGKVVLVNFWATWCGPCRVELPDLVQLQKEFGPKGFTVIGLSGDDSLDTAAAFAKEQKLNYPIIMNTPEIVKNYGSPDGIPVTYLINKEGKVVWERQGVDMSQSVYSVLKEQIEPLL